MERAEKEGRSVGVNPATQQILEIRSFQKVGYRFMPDDLEHWQWQALVEVDRAIEEHQKKELEKHGTKRRD